MNRIEDYCILPYIYIFLIVHWYILVKNIFVNMTGPTPAVDPNAPDLNRMEKFVNIKEFDGKDLSYAQEFLERFELLRAAKGWNEATSLFYFKILLTRQANIWRKGLTTEIRATYDGLKTAFTSHFVNSEPKMVVESRLASRRWLMESESIDVYANSLVELGSKCDRTGDSLCSDFLRGLPDSVRTFCASSDTHTMTSYIARGKLYVAMHENEFRVGGGAAAQEPVNAFRERGRSKSPAARGRGMDRQEASKRTDRCFECDGIGHMAKECASRRNRKEAPPRGRSPSPRRKERSTSRDKNNKRICFRCDESGHIARFCPTRKSREDKSN